MTRMTARLHFSFPYALAEQYLREGLAPTVRPGVREILLTARIPATHIELGKNVLVTCSKNSSEDACWDVGWIPEPGGVYPEFEGKLCAYPGANHAILQLSGHYTPPLGAAGEVFDRVLGRKITMDTMHDFLLNVAAEIKVRYAYEEARELFRETESAGETLLQP